MIPDISISQLIARRDRNKPRRTTLNMPNQHTNEQRPPVQQDPKKLIAGALKASRLSPQQSR